MPIAIRTEEQVHYTINLQLLGSYRLAKQNSMECAYQHDNNSISSLTPLVNLNFLKKKKKKREKAKRELGIADTATDRCLLKKDQI